MMQPETFQTSWPFYDVMDLAYESFGGCEFSPLFEFIDRPFGVAKSLFSPLAFGETAQIMVSDDLTVSLEAFDPDLSGELGSFYGCLDESVGSFPSQVFSVEENDDQWSPNSSQSTKSEASIDVTSMQQILILPCEDMEIEKELSVCHLLRAYGNALEKRETELGNVILRRIGEKSSPLGKAIERIGFNLSREVVESEYEYLKQESAKNFDAAFNAMCRILPYVKFANFTANSAILEATPDDAETIHIVDFDIGEGLQWSQMIEGAARQHKRLKLTAIKWEKREIDDSDPTEWSFEETRRKLLHHARLNGVKLKLEEIRIEDLVSELKKAKKNGGEREFLAFNCVVGLPHMRRVRSRRLVMEFLRLAKDLLANSVGILVLGDGDPCEKLVKTCPSFSTFFDGHLLHYKALLESVESGFPTHLVEARVAVECLFIAPYVSPRAWLDKWDQVRAGCHLGLPEIGLEGWELSEESVVEGNEMVRGEGCYEVRIEGVNGNEAALEWNGIPLLRVSAWKSQS